MMASNGEREMNDLLDARTIAIEAAETAGDLVRDGLFRNLAVRDKGSSGDVVTSLDIASEKAIISVIRSHFPGHQIISEEIGQIGKGGRWKWLIDPVDGTNNIVLGLPVLTIGITLCRDDSAVASVVHDPISRRTWSAIHEKGAWSTDGQRMDLPRTSSKRKPVFAWIQGYSVSRDDQKARALKFILADGARRVLDLWAPLTCWMMLARGDIDGIVGYRIGELDLHGGALIASEVGLTIHTFSGTPFVPRLRGTGDNQCVIAGTNTVVHELGGMVASADRLAGRIATAVSPELSSTRLPRVRPPAGSENITITGKSC
jgi:myo-inositol-1(or 4)-monophosphatase